MCIEKTFQTNSLDIYHSLKLSLKKPCTKKNINGGIVVSKRVFRRHAKDLALEFGPKNVEGSWKSEGMWFIRGVIPQSQLLYDTCICTTTIYVVFHISHTCAHTQVGN